MVFAWLFIVIRLFSYQQKPDKCCGDYEIQKKEDGDDVDVFICFECLEDQKKRKDFLKKLDKNIREKMKTHKATPAVKKEIEKNISFSKKNN